MRERGTLRAFSLSCRQIEDTSSCWIKTVDLWKTGNRAALGAGETVRSNARYDFEGSGHLIVLAGGEGLLV